MLWTADLTVVLATLVLLVNGIVVSLLKETVPFLASKFLQA